MRSCTFYSAAVFVFLSVYAFSNCFMLGWGWLGGVGWGNNVLALAHPLAFMSYAFLLAMSYELLHHFHIFCTLHYLYIYILLSLLCPKKFSSTSISSARHVI